MSSYRPDYAGVEEWGRSAEMRSMLQDRARAAQTAAEAAAARWPDYAGSFSVGAEEAVVGWRKERRAAATLYNTHPSAGRIEWNHAVMANAVAAAEAGGV